MSDTSKMGRPVTYPDGDNIIAQLRRKKGWRQQQTEDALGLSRKQISKLARGLYPINKTVQILAKLLLAE